ncbi:hypothetical protein OXA12_06785 [Acinetobacter baumannii]|uniref:hypothetical protein n=2 Tax=Acinetobacter baumannii TaxID=470 RepID=UPI001867DD00|nr:hypothetical protein [Acinetobacter baumannii]MCY2772721.1 hypothetical protein [Acinetobacter baumannii]MCY2775641.1 hypothetical protein [Acinetobacter baumannii]MCY2798809.1 hypothetical protein [Acinetobacter baumannii]MCY2805939.1 hypothetical protein [Acinetobacter baumannii]MCY2886120.1 hypothetical protein [Acinetobacter baumannii]
MKFNFSIDIAVIVTLTAIFLFVLGQSYLGGFLSPFYIEPVVLNFSTQDKIYWGYVKGRKYLIFLFLVLTFLYTFVYAIIPQIVNERRFLIIRKIVAMKLIFERKFYRRDTSKNSKRNRKYLALIYAFFLLPLCVVFSIFSIATEGAIAGRDLLNHLDKRPLVKISESKLTIPHYRILCGTNLCVVIDKERNVSLVEPKTIIYLSSNFR